MHAISSNPSMVGDSNVSIDIQCNIAQNRLGSNSVHSILKTRQGPRDKNNNNNNVHRNVFSSCSVLLAVKLKNPFSVTT